jgi:hypothetical protein
VQRGLVARDPDQPHIRGACALDQLAIDVLVDGIE